MACVNLIIYSKEMLMSALEAVVNPSKEASLYGEMLYLLY